MGRGTISLNHVPKKKKLYGDEYFHLRPIYLGENGVCEGEYCYFLRPSDRHGYEYEIEGEFGVGEKSYLEEKKEVFRKVYSNTKYYYLEEDLPKMSKTQKKRILKWATNGEF